ncbi:MAG: hypothetical protein ABH803_02640 [Candidatus Micrarchaeota archaeon]
MTEKFNVYKPRKTGNGAAVQFDFNESVKAVFVETTMQSGEQQFDWQNKIVFKLASMDSAKIITVLEGKSKGIDLFHDMSKSKFSSDSSTKNTTLTLSKGDYGFFFKLSKQKTDGSVQTVNCSLSEEEGVILRILLSKAIEKSFGW